jgi:hypothetical protein
MVCFQVERGWINQYHVLTSPKGFNYCHVIFCITISTLVRGLIYLENYESQWEGLSHILLWKIKHV